MKNALVLCILILFLCSTPEIKAQCVNDDTNVYSFTIGQTEYELVRENLVWEEAAACAAERGGILAEVLSQEIQDQLFEELMNNAGIDVNQTIAPDGGGASYIWLGGNDLAEEGHWIWDGDHDGEGNQFWEGQVNGSPVGDHYVNWGIEPDNYNNQDALGYALTNWPLGSAGQWNDVDAGNELFYLIQYPDDPSNADQLYSQNGIKIYPNPCHGKLFIDTAKIPGRKEITLVDRYLRPIAQFPMTGNTYIIDMQLFPLGTYYILLGKTAIPVLHTGTN